MAKKSKNIKQLQEPQEPVEILQQIHKICLKILAYAELDCEITLDGRGISSYEASHVAKAVLKIMNRTVDPVDLALAVSHATDELGWNE